MGFVPTGIRYLAGNQAHSISHQELWGAVNLSISFYFRIVSTLLMDKGSTFVYSICILHFLYLIYSTAPWLRFPTPPPLVSVLVGDRRQLTGDGVVMGGSG